MKFYLKEVKEILILIPKKLNKNRYATSSCKSYDLPVKKEFSHYFFINFFIIISTSISSFGVNLIDFGIYL